MANRPATDRPAGNHFPEYTRVLSRARNVAVHEEFAARLMGDPAFCAYLSSDDRASWIEEATRAAEACK